MPSGGSDWAGCGIAGIKTVSARSKDDAACPKFTISVQVLLLVPAYYPRHVRRGEPRTGCGIPATVTGLTACSSISVDLVAIRCPSGCPYKLAASGVPRSDGKLPRPPAVNELAGRPPRAAQVSRNWLLASNKVSGSTVRLLLMSVLGAAR